MRNYLDLGIVKVNDNNDITFIISEAPVRSHLKNVYATLTMSIMAASAGAYVHLFTDTLKVKPISFIRSQSKVLLNHIKTYNLTRVEA